MIVTKLFGKNWKKDLSTPKSNSLNFSITDSENSYRLETFQVNTQERNEMNIEDTQPAGTTQDVQNTNAGMENKTGEQEIQSKNEGDENAASNGTMTTEPTAPARRMKQSRATTDDTTPEPEDSYEYLEKKEREEAMIRLWRQTALPKKLSFPGKYPAYLKEPPELSYEDTSTSMRRKMFNYRKIEEMTEKPFERVESKVKHLSPKMNQTVEIRSRYIKKEPLVSAYFSEHYNKYGKPPFKNTNVKFYT
ncbi:hypothetical protein PGB90_002968 [Kerria lacca]